MVTEAKKTVFLTGATGSMGSATFRELLLRRTRFNIVVLVRDTKYDRLLLRKFMNEPGVRIVWGDLRDYDSVLDAVTGADVVLHTAALISPAADLDPVLTEQINVGSIRNIVRAIKAQPDPDAVRFVAVGTVAATGSRLPPIHWGRVGDPIAPSIDDRYAVAKIEAERLVVESGLKHWACVRQTFICIPKLLSLMHPIMYHQPVNTVFEFVTDRDSGRLMANAAEDDVPDDFWRRVYNIGGGETCRVGYVDYLDRIFGTLGIGRLHQLTQRNWFALKNFHLQYYLDSDVLEGYLHFRRDSLDDYVAHMAASAPWYLRIGLARIVVRTLIRGLVMKKLARQPAGPLRWIEKNDTEKIDAFFGSREAWERIPGWDEPIPAPTPPMPLDHGYDDSLPDAAIGLREAVSAAKFRGGECLNTTMTDGDLHTPLRWKCVNGHEFDATAYLVLRAGHWCRECAPPPWRDDRAVGNPFLAQVVDLPQPRDVG